MKSSQLFFDTRLLAKTTRLSAMLLHISGTSFALAMRSPSITITVVVGTSIAIAGYLFSHDLVVGEAHGHKKNQNTMYERIIHEYYVAWDPMVSKRFVPRRDLNFCEIGI